MKIRLIFLFALTVQWLTVFSQQPAPSDLVFTDESLADTTLAWPLRMQTKISHLLDSKLFDISNVGILVYDMDADSVLYEHNSRQLLRPGSTMKAITAITALDKLGANHLFKTGLYYTGEMHNGVLEGDIYCKGGMDPSFGEQQMNYFVEIIKQQGIDTIKGHLVADVSMKDTLLWGEGWCWDDPNPSLTPLIYKKKNIFMQTLKEKLHDEGIEVLEGDSTGTVPSDAKLLTEELTSLPFILMQMMKISDNLYAESMLYQLGPTAKDAFKQMEDVLHKAGVEEGGYRLADGSGLSLYDYLSPDLEVKMLRYAYDHKDIFNTLYPTLPISGVDGTLASRMKDGPACGKIHAKTGTVTGASALAGYFVSPTGHNIVFSIINQGVMNSKNSRFFQDKVCEAMTL